MASIRSSGSVDSDVAWQLWIAGRLHAGARLYTDIIETNPPLWFWMAVPIERLSALLRLPIEPVLIAFIGCLVALSLGATDRLIAHLDHKRRALFLGYGALLLFALPWIHVGQREQLALIATLPYAALAAARRDARKVDPWLALLVGAGAALGFALKHYFLLVPLLLELWLIQGRGRNWRPIRCEALALVLVGACYGAAILLLAPDFLLKVVPLIRLAYADFGARKALDLFGPHALCALAILAMLAAHARTLCGRGAPLASALTIAALGYCAIYFIQYKGWPYQAIPMIGCAALAIAALFAQSDSPSPQLRLIGPALLVLPLILGEDEARLQPPHRSDLEQAVFGMTRGDSIGFLTTENAIAWPVTLQDGFVYPSRYDGFWMMGAIVLNEREGNRDPRLAALGRRVISETVRDFTCFAPRRIIVSRPTPGAHEFDILPFFKRDPAFRQLMSHYRLRGLTTLERFDRVSPLPKPSFACRKGISS